MKLRQYISIAFLVLLAAMGGFLTGRSSQQIPQPERINIVREKPLIGISSTVDGKYFRAVYV